MTDKELIETLQEQIKNLNLEVYWLKFALKQIAAITNKELEVTAE